MTSTTLLSLGILVDIVEQDDECNEDGIKENLLKEIEMVKIQDRHNCKDEEFQAKDLVQKKKKIINWRFYHWSFQRKKADHI